MRIVSGYKCRGCLILLIVTRRDHSCHIGIAQAPENPVSERMVFVTQSDVRTLSSVRVRRKPRACGSFHSEMGEMTFTEEYLKAGGRQK